MIITIINLFTVCELCIFKSCNIKEFYNIFDSWYIINIAICTISVIIYWSIKFNVQCSKNCEKLYKCFTFTKNVIN